MTNQIARRFCRAWAGTGASNGSRRVLALCCATWLLWPSPAHAASFDFGSLWQLQIVNMFSTQQLSLGELTVSTPSPDRLTWTPDGFGVTGPTERTFATRVIGLPYEWDEVESTQQLTLQWPQPVYVDTLGLSNFFAGEQRGGFTFNELLWLRLDGQFPHLVTAQWADGELGLWGLGWVQALTLDAPGGWLDHDFSVRSVSWHQGEHEVPEPALLVLFSVGLVAVQLGLRRMR